MNLLVSFVPLVLLAWSAQHAGALPNDDRLQLQGNGVLAKDQSEFLLKILSRLSERSRVEKDQHDSDNEKLRQAKFGERSLAGQPVPRERSPCKNFFWKTFSSC